MSQPTDTDTPFPIILDETDSESDLEDGGIPLEVDSMQIDTPNETETAGSLSQLAGGEIDFIDYGHVGDGSDFLPTAPHPHARPVQHSAPAINTDENVQRAARIRTRTREEEHAALCVLDDWELTMTHALTSRRTITQTRRRFQAKMLAPTNPRLEEDLYGARFAVPEMQTELVPSLMAPGRKGVKQVSTVLGTGTAFLVPAAWKEVVSHDEESWWPGGRVRQAGSSGSGRKRKSLVAGSRSESRSVSGSGGSSRVVSRGASRAASRGLD
ncbi:uncharacterized protein N7469_001644 [Penicillium citrinum]|uniref:Uncharacterized protein n=2 Tax=Penicillium TaxID=5073 RepID=A0A9W9PEW8_PENCI|nr:uncharacterized protein N7469_001644 [Penicillium citrinum]KAJ5243317.1 hypothetical protein N7469_001644 [Penicillium citrinum]KAJ5599180.1 hypothetical protein N7450_000247 [Penicillium hetheringtonii]